MMIRWFVVNVLKARWIVNEDGELGLRIAGINLWYYKGSDPMVDIGNYNWRVAEKREFGEVVLTRKYRDVAQSLLDSPGR